MRNGSKEVSRASSKLFKAQLGGKRKRERKNGTPRQNLERKDTEAALPSLSAKHQRKKKEKRFTDESGRGTEGGEIQEWLRR